MQMLTLSEKSLSSKRKRCRTDASFSPRLEHLPRNAPCVALLAMSVYLLIGSPWSLAIARIVLMFLKSVNNLIN